MRPKPAGMIGNRPGPPYSVSQATARRLVALLAFALITGAAQTPAPPTAADTALRTGEAAAMIQQGAVSEAVSLLSEVVRASPNDAEAHLLLGSALSLVPRRQESIRALLRSLDLDGDNPQLHTSAGMALARLGEQDAAMQVFERAVSLDPAQGQAHLNIALILAGKEAFDRAAHHMAKALSLERDGGRRARLHLLNGKLHVEREQLEEAAGEFRRSIELDPSSGEAHVTLGLTLKRLLREDEAYTLFERAVELVPEDPTAHYQLALELRRRGDARAAADHLLRAHELSPEDQAIMYNLTRALHSAGRLAESKAFREKLSAMIAANDQARENEIETARLHGEAVRLESAGRYAEALDIYRQVLEVEPLNVVARRNYALVLCRLERWDAGIQELEAILRDDPDDAETKRVLAIVLDQSQQFSKQ